MYFIVFDVLKENALWQQLVSFDDMVMMEGLSIGRHLITRDLLH